MKHSPILFVAFLSFLSLSHGYAQENISPEALRYFDDAFRQVRENSYKNKTIDFDKLYKESLAKMKGAQTSRDTYDAIRYLLSGLKDNHSFFAEAPKNGESIISRLSSKPGGIPFTASIIDGQYGLLALKSYNSVDNADQRRIADSIYSVLREMQQQHVKGLIIDFTKMEGGSTLPFLCGFMPLIDKDMLLGYKDNKGHRTQMIRYKSALIFKNRRKRSTLCYLSTYTPFSQYLSNQPIAIITGKYTASAGEMILISFLGLPNVKTFGETTYGVPTGKSNIFLSDGAFISL
ncbi:MAG: hypothetical protein JST39_20005, partial [Bacteroidetes bacterium]|nr:hypothetical protein [Bacteroidota bacterium]